MGLVEKIAGMFRAPGRPASRVGRNDPCWCGSGRKYKRCHLEADLRREQGRLRGGCATS